MPAIEIASVAAEGIVHLGGRVRVDRRQLRSWGRGDRCVAYDYWDYKGVGERAMLPFWLIDATGRAHVFGPSAQLALPRTRWDGPAPALIGAAMLARRGLDCWHEEALLRDGDLVEVIGHATIRPDDEVAAATGDGPFRTARRLLELRSERRQVIKILPPRGEP